MNHLKTNSPKIFINTATVIANKAALLLFVNFLSNIIANSIPIANNSENIGKYNDILTFLPVPKKLITLALKPALKLKSALSPMMNNVNETPNNKTKNIVDAINNA